MSDPSFSNWVGKDMYALLEVTLTTNIGEIPVGAEVTLRATQPDPGGNYPEYEAFTDENGECTITGIWKGNYDLRAELMNFTRLEDNIDIEEDVVYYEGMITEMIYPVFDVYVEENHSGNAFVIWHSPTGPLSSFFDFEDDDGEFISNTGWEWGTDTVSGAFSGENVWGTVLNTEYPNNASLELVTPEITIPPDEAVLSFWHWMDIETSWDGGNVKISIDGGTSWTLINPAGGYPGTAYSLNGEACFNGYSQTWQMVTFDIGEYNGEDAMFKFHFGSDSSVTYQGWYIDDVYVGEPEDRYRLQPVHTDKTQKVNLLSRAIEPDTRLERLEGYTIMRGFADDQANFEDWELIVAAHQDTTYEDVTWQQIPEPGTYKYCVLAMYTNGVLSEPAFSNSIYNEGATLMYGDVTGDFIVDAFDAANILQYTVGMDPSGAPLPWTWQMTAADVSGDTEVDAYDAALVLQYSVGIIDIFPVETRETFIYPVAEIISASGELYSLMADFNQDIESGVFRFQEEYGLLCFAHRNRLAFASAYALSGEICRIEYDNYENLIGTAVSGTVNENDFTVYIEELPRFTELNSIYPNPFNPETTICFSLAEKEHIKLTVYNLRGQKIATILNETMDPGIHQITWRPQNTASGIYFLNMLTDSTNQVQKVVLLK